MIHKFFDNYERTKASFNVSDEDVWDMHNLQNWLEVVKEVS
ncbi:hypothetical protein K3495_g3027 [Podosphaera aphanis]|nr:hypothetical protein K3495_g3027 [Podosphaera aphanis]